jgi:hypothetical protein
MRGHDAELERLRAGVSCAVLLECLPPPWRLDRAESTRRCLKYRRRKGEVLIVTHEGRGWWDPMSPAKGDVFALAQHLDPGLSFGQVRRVLRPFIGLSPTCPALAKRRERQASPVPVIQRWAWRESVRRGSAAWRYLTGGRALPEAVVLAALRAGVLREGPHASAWFAHLDHAGRLSGIEMRGPAWRGFSPGGSKTLFRLPGGAPASLRRPTRLAVTEAAIEAMSLAALEGLRAGTLYLGVAGGMGPRTVTALRQLLGELSGDPAAVLVAATNADAAGERYAERLAGMAAEAGLRSERLLPTDGQNDFNDALKTGRELASAREKADTTTPRDGLGS